MVTNPTNVHSVVPTYRNRRAITFMLMIVYALLIFLGRQREAAGEPVGPRQATQVHMGVKFTVVLCAADDETANRGFEAAFARIDELDRMLSDYDEDSELSRLSSAAPTPLPVPVSEELWQVLVAAQEVSQASDGAFDVTVGPLTRLWRRARRRHALPSDDQLREALAAVGYQQIRLQAGARTVELLRPNMRLDLGGIAKGYAADQALRELRAMGIRAALINASGDLAIGDPPPGQRGWNVALAPLEPGADSSRTVQLANCGVATSGDAWQYVEIDGTRYSHIVDPHTGLGLTQRSGVTVIASNCTTADSWASALSVLGPQRGLQVVEKHEELAAMVVVVVDGQAQVRESANFRQRVDDPATQLR